MPPTIYTVAQYISGLRAIHFTGSATPETSFYPPVSQLLNAAGQGLKPPVLFSTQLRDQGAGIPDGGFFPQPNRSRRNAVPQIVQNPERGVVEIKPAEYNLDTLTHEEQTLRYLQHYGLVLITNLREFRLLKLTAGGIVQTLERYTLANTAVALWTAPITSFVRHSNLLPDFLARVMLYSAPLVQPKDVAWLLASYAREARARAEDHPLESFRAVKIALQESLGIQFEGEKGEHFFRSTLVQTLFYGIFSAWILWRRTPEGRVPDAQFNWRLSAYYLRVPVIRKLFGEVAQPGALDEVQLQEILNLAGEALNRIQPAFFETFREDQAVAYFYEPFLEAFDPELRKELGVWYTPKEIVQYMVERVDQLLRTELGQSLGLASPAVRILDPCCGTGAYLTAVLHRIHRTLLEQAGDDAALVPNDLRTIALSRVFGFEIMPAPFVISHLQIASLLEDAHAPLTENQRAGVYLTNALTGWVPEAHPQTEIFEEFRHEREDSDNIKQQGPILVILGNPPYNGYAGIAKIDEERDLTRTYHDPVAGLPAPQGHGLNDLYIRFFRIAERRIAANADGKGIVSFISNYSWLDGLSHPTMRYNYLNTFDEIFIDNLHGDRKISEYAPDGRTSETIFAVTGTSVGIRIGTAISTLVRKTRSTTTAGTVHYRDFEDARASDRRESLVLSTITNEPLYTSLAPSPTLGLPFKPRTFDAEYLKWPRLPELFPVSFPGIKTSRDSLVVGIDRNDLESRMQQYLGTDASDAEIAALVPGAMKSSKRFNPVDTRRTLQAKGFRPWQIIRYTYRPFDLRWLYWEPETKLLDEKREDFVRLRAPSDMAIIVPRQNRVTVDGPLVSFGLADVNLVDGSASAFPASVVSDHSLTAGEIYWNAPCALVDFLSERGTSMQNFLLHIVATLHAPAYLSTNRGGLLRDWPRVPLPSSTDLLSHSSALGRRLADLLDAESSVNLAAEWSFLAALKLPLGIAIEEALKITAGWGYLSGNAVMPGTGVSPTRLWTDPEREKLTTLAAAQSLTLDDVLALLGDTCVDVHLNGAAFWSAVPTNVWDYTLGGYQVLKKWLSYRELPLLGRPLYADEAQYLAQVVRRITAILLLGPRLDASYQAIIPTATGLPTS